ncbi:ATP-binding cassette domain-containing protein [Acinetobacter sp. YH16032]|uniref:ATP-binding cassette domain-containing protein n=1 Tax=Acinetobacter sp. YH16032 TaxID=2601181 RepID=UPI00359F3FD7
MQEIYKNFSGGEKQRLNIIRALLKKPELLILDEPTAALDEKTSSKILKIIQERVETVIMISHERMATEIADEIIDFNIILNSIDED